MSLQLETNRNQNLHKQIVSGSIPQIQPVTGAPEFFFVDKSIVTSTNPEWVIFQGAELLPITVEASKTPRRILRQRKSSGQRAREQDSGTETLQTAGGGDGKKPPVDPPTLMGSADANSSDENHGERVAMARRIQEILGNIFTASDQEKIPPGEPTHQPTGQWFESRRQLQALNAIKDSSWQKFSMAVQAELIPTSEQRTIRDAFNAVLNAKRYHGSIPYEGLYFFGANDQRISIENFGDSATAALSLGSLLRFDMAVEKFLELTEPYTFARQAQEFIELVRIPYGSFLGMQIDGVPIAPVLAKRSESPEQLQRAMRVFMEAYRLVIHAELLGDATNLGTEEHEKNEARTFAAVVYSMIDDRTKAFDALLQVHVRSFIENFLAVIDSDKNKIKKSVRLHTKADMSKEAQRAEATAELVVANISTMRSNLHAVLADPEHLQKMPSGFIEMVRSYLAQEGILSDQFLHLVMLDQPDNLINAFRQHRRADMTVQGNSVDISAVLYRFAQHSGIFTMEDVEDILIDHQEEGDSDERVLVEPWDALGRVANDIRKLQRESHYSLMPDDVDMAYVFGNDFVVPSAVSVDFDKLNPGDFVVTLGYENEVTHESLDLSLKINAKRQLIDWTVLEDIPEAHRNTFLQVSLRLLTLLEDKVRRDKQAKIATPSNLVPAIRGRKEKDHYVDPIFSLRKEKANFTHVQMQREATAPQVTRIKFEIVLTAKDRDTIRKLPENIGKAVYNGIAKYNEGKKGRFRPMVSRYTGEMLWRLRVMGYRVLVKESGSTDGHMRFEIVDIRKKNETYRHAAGL